MCLLKAKRNLPWQAQDQSKSPENWLPCDFVACFGAGWQNQAVVKIGTLHLYALYASFFSAFGVRCFFHVVIFNDSFITP